MTWRLRKRIPVESMAKMGAHVYVSGEVQGVGFRYSAIREANALGLTGWVRNLDDGRVEVFAEGEEDAVQEMIAWCKRGPRSAEVTDTEVELQPYRGKFTRFDVMF